MKETQIAKENVKGCGKKWCYGAYECGKDNKSPYCQRCRCVNESHLKSCQRFLEYLQMKQEMICNIEGCGEIDDSFTAYCIKHGRSPHILTFNIKIKDLQTAIKVYEDGGVR